MKIEAGAERFVNVLFDLFATWVSYVVQEAVVVMKVFPSIESPMLLLIWSSGHFPQIPADIWCHPDSMCEFRGAGRARSKGFSDSNRWRLCQQDCKCRRTIERFCRKIYRRVLICTNPACHMMFLLTRAPTFRVQLQTLTAVVKPFLFKPD